MNLTEWVDAEIGRGPGHWGHKGRIGKRGGSLPKDQLNPEGSTVEKYHPKVSDGGMWGHSHSQSSYISGEAAEIMVIEGYETDEVNKGAYNKAATKFLQAISDDEIGTEEVLYHGFQNRRKIEFKPGDTFKIPLTATSGGMDAAMGYGLRLDRRDQQGAPTVFVFPMGTPMAAYQTWNKADAKEFGHKYSEALVAGEFQVVKSSFIEMNMPQHDSRAGESWHPTTVFNVVELEPVSIFDMDTKSWRK